MVSLPVAPKIRSACGPPEMMSSPASPSRLSLPPLPEIVSLPAPPSRYSLLAVPTIILPTEALELLKTSPELNPRLLKLGLRYTLTLGGRLGTANVCPWLTLGAPLVLTSNYSGVALEKVGSLKASAATKSHAGLGISGSLPEITVRAKSNNSDASALSGVPVAFQALRSARENPIWLVASSGVKNTGNPFDAASKTSFAACGSTQMLNSETAFCFRSGSRCSLRLPGTKTAPPMM